MKHLGLCAVVALWGCGGSSGSASIDAPASSDGPGAAVDSSPGVDAPPAGTDPAQDGSSTVTTATASIPGATAGRTVAATVFTPSDAGMRPLVVISPGFKMARAQYTSYAHHLATWGFVVVLTDYADSSFFPDHQKLADDVGAVIDWALAQPALAIDPLKIATVGHSLGGKISMLAASDDHRIKAVVGWDPVDSSSPSVAPEKMTMPAAIAVVGETTDGAGGGMPCAPTAENFQQFYAAAGSPALAITVKGADHMDWVDDPTCALCTFCTAGTAAPALARTVSRRLDVAWLRRKLLDDAAMQPWLDAPPELAAMTITLAQK